MPRQAIRTRLIDFACDASGAYAVRHELDGLLIVEDGRFVESGCYSVLQAALRPDDAIADCGGLIALPGFIDAHIHLPQIDVIASPARGLLDWLERHTFRVEAAFADPEVAREGAHFLLDELARNGTTSACVLSSSHRVAVEALFEEALLRDLRMVAGKCLMDRHCPPDVRDGTEQGVRESAELADRWHGRGRLGYAITPRFAATSTERQLRLAGELAQARPELYVQSHVAENRDEVRWIAELFPSARSYLDVYDRVGLLTPRSIYAHCIHLDGQDRRRMAAVGAVAAVCPTSNLFLGSGVFDFQSALDDGMPLALATDVGGGQSFSMFETMRAAHDVGRLRGTALTAIQLWAWSTAGAARVLGWEHQVGALRAGMEADFILVDPACTPLLERRTARAQSTEELLFALLVLADDRAVAQTYIAGRPVKAPQGPR